MLSVCWNLQPGPDLGPFSVCLLQEPQLSPHTENTELRRWKEGNQRSWKMRNPKKSKVMIEELFAKGGEDKDKLSFENSRGSEECTVPSKSSRNRLS